jgi:DNA-binding NarL/FixJ family response regulator
MNELRILLADDHEMMREGLKLLIDRQPDMEVVGEADDGESAVLLVQELKPDIVLMDVSMPRMNGAKATIKLKRLFPQIHVIALTRHTDEGYLQQLLEAGASGYVLKKSASAMLIEAIRAVMAGGTFIDPKVAEKIVGGYINRRFSSGAPSFASLSNREVEILRFIALGYSSKEIGARFKISHKTVEVHKTNAMKKMGMRSRIDIVRFALLKGWLQET